MTTINKEELIEWLEKMIEHDKAMGATDLVNDSRMVLTYIKSMPSRPSDAELIGWTMDKGKDHDFVLSPQWSGWGDSDLQTWALVHEEKIYSWNRGEPMPPEARAILEQEWRKANP